MSNAKLSIRDRLKARQPVKAAVEPDDIDVEETEEEEAPAPAKKTAAKAPVAPAKRGPKPKAVVEEEPEEEDETEEEEVEEDVDTPVDDEADEEEVEEEEVEEAPAKRGPKPKATTAAKAPVAPAKRGPKPKAVVEEEDEIEEEVEEAPKKRGPKPKGEVAVAPAKKPGLFSKAKADTAAKKQYNEGDWIDRSEYLNRILPKFEGTEFEDINKTQLEKLVSIIEAATVEILQTNDIRIFGVKSKSTNMCARVYPPSVGGLEGVSTQYSSEISAHRKTVLTLTFDKHRRIGNVNDAGDFIEGQFNGKKFTPGVWKSKDEFVPKKK